MRHHKWIPAVASALLISHCALAQDPILNALKMNHTDVAELKRRAEAGDVNAQFKFADLLAGRNRSAEALAYYRKVAVHGSSEARFRIGAMLFRGAGGVTRDQRVEPNLAEAMPILYNAATNGNREAWKLMQRAYNEGRGVTRDTVQAYAWLQLLADTSPPFDTAHRAEVNSMALNLDVATSQAGKQLAAEMKAGRWPPLLLPAAKPSGGVPPQGVKLNGILRSGKIPLVIINSKTLAEGESAAIPVKPKPVTLKCLKIEEQSVVLQMEGETLPFRLVR